LQNQKNRIIFVSH